MPHNLFALPGDEDFQQDCGWKKPAKKVDMTLDDVESSPSESEQSEDEESDDESLPPTKKSKKGYKRG